MFCSSARLLSGRLAYVIPVHLTRGFNKGLPPLLARGGVALWPLISPTHPGAGDLTINVVLALRCVSSARLSVGSSGWRVLGSSAYRLVPLMASLESRRR